jgi:hypothetical protein
MKVQMKDNLILMYQSCLKNELHFLFINGRLNEYFKIKNFLKSIEGKVIEIVFTSGDAFEKNDNNIWLPESLFYTLEK